MSGAKYECQVSNVACHLSNVTNAKRHSHRPSLCYFPHYAKQDGLAAKSVKTIVKLIFSIQGGSDPAISEQSYIPRKYIQRGVVDKKAISKDGPMQPSEDMPNERDINTGTKSSSGCTTMKLRKDIRKLNNQEKQKLEAALAKMLETGKFHVLANYHKGPGPAMCIHGKTEFLAWHRLYAVEFEEALGMPLPYWDFIEDATVPELWSRVRIRLPPNRPEEPPWVRDLEGCPGDNNFLKRKTLVDMNSHMAELKSEMTEAFLKEDYDLFYGALDDPHTTMHGILGCHMAEEPSSYDPVFWMMHAAVDRQFAFWQQLQGLRKNKIPSKIPGPERIQLFNTTGNHEGSDTLDYKTEFCYEFDTLEFDGMTAERFQQKQKMRKRFRTAGSKNIFVGVVIPIEAPTANHTFKLCQRTKRKVKCIAGGGVGAFCPLCIYTPSKIDESTHVIREHKVTKLVHKAKWDRAKMTAYRTNKKGLSLPEPLLILRDDTDNEGGQVTLAPGQKAGDYGNLLKKYKYKVIDRFESGEPYSLSDNKD